MACCVRLLCVLFVDVIGGADVFVGVSWMDGLIVGCVVVSIRTVVGVGRGLGRSHRSCSLCWC